MRDIIVDAGFLSSEAKKAEERRRRFAAEAASPPPPLPVRTMAWPGGRVTHNKEAATESFLKRKEENLTAEELSVLRKRLADSLRSRRPTATLPVHTEQTSPTSSVGTVNTRPQHRVGRHQRRQRPPRPLRCTLSAPWAWRTSTLKFLTARRIRVRAD